MPKTYDPIATYTVPSPQASYTFSSIPGTYTDLICIMRGNIESGTDASLYWRANGDTSALYSGTRIMGDGSTATSYRDSAATAALSGLISTTSLGVNIFHFMNYANTTTFKTSLSRGNNPSITVGAFASLYRSTNAITSLTFYSPTANLFTGMDLTLYGIKAA